MLWLLILIATGIRLHSFFSYPVHSWDGSVYIGIGKYFFSGGQIGLFEVFRPILLPLIEGVVWKIGIDPLFIGSMLTIMASVGLLFLVYKIGEQSSKYAGIVAVTILGFTPIFLTFGHQPLTDTLSTCLVVLSIYVMLKGRYYTAGVLVGLAFLSRFSQGLGIVVLGISTLLLTAHTTHVGFLKAVFRKGLCILAGFATVALPYFLWAYSMFGNPFIPLEEGNKIIGHSAHVYMKGPWFYATALIANNPFLIFAIAGLALAVIGFVRKKLEPGLVVSLVGLIIYATYFTYEPHKELRYAIPFLPFLALMAGYFFSILFERIRIGQIAVGLLCLGTALFLIDRHSERVDPPFSEMRNVYYSYFDDMPYGTAILATEPMSVARGQTRLVSGLYDSWSSARAVWKREKAEIDYVALDSCTLESACSVDATCQDDKEEFINELSASGELVFSGTDRSCILQIYSFK